MTICFEHIFERHPPQHLWNVGRVPHGPQQELKEQNRLLIFVRNIGLSQKCARGLKPDRTWALMAMLVVQNDHYCLEVRYPIYYSNLTPNWYEIIIVVASSVQLCMSQNRILQVFDGFHDHLNEVIPNNIETMLK